MKKKNLFLILGLVALCVVIAAIPLLTIHDSEFGGADGQAEEVIAQMDPDYEPWAESLLEPPGGETESLLFALQAAVGSGVIFFTFGYLLARKKYRKVEET